MTEILCTNTYFSFNHYLPMKELMEQKKIREVYKRETKNSTLITEFRKQMSSHYGRFVLTENTTKLSRTASMLDPQHMVLILLDDTDLKPFTDDLVEIIQDIPNAYVPETQMVGSSQTLLI